MPDCAKFSLHQLEEVDAHNAVQRWGDPAWRAKTLAEKREQRSAVAVNQHQLQLTFRQLKVNVQKHPH